MSNAFYFRPDQRELLVCVLQTVRFQLRPDESSAIRPADKMACRFTSARIDEIIAYIESKGKDIAT